MTRLTGWRRWRRAALCEYPASCAQTDHAQDRQCRTGACCSMMVRTECSRGWLSRSRAGLSTGRPAPRWRPRAECRRLHECCDCRSPVTHPRIDGAVENVDKQVEAHNERRVEHDDAKHQRVVTVECAAHKELP